MTFKNNQFTEEPDADHAIRVRQMAAGLAIYGVDLGFLPAEIAEYDTYSDNIDTALNKQQEESADVDEIYVELSIAYDDALAKYRACQSIVKGEMEFADSGTVEYLNERFFIGEDLPKNNKGFIKMLEYMVKAKEALAVEHPDVTLPDAPFDALKLSVAAFDANLAATGKELADQKAATASKNVLRKTMGEKLLRKCFHRAVAYWGDDDPRMLELGLVPKSQIWTPGSGEPEPGVEGVPWPGPMAGFEVNLIALPLTTEIIFTRIFDCPKCVLERELEGTGAWEFITEYDLEEEEILPFRDNVPHPGKWHYRATPFNAVGEVGVVSEGTIEVV